MRTTSDIYYQNHDQATTKEISGRVMTNEQVCNCHGCHSLLRVSKLSSYKGVLLCKICIDVYDRENNNVNY